MNHYNIHFKFTDHILNDQDKEIAFVRLNGVTNIFFSSFFGAGGGASYAINSLTNYQNANVSVPA